MSPERSYKGPYKATTATASEPQKSKATTLRVHHPFFVNFFACTTKNGQILSLLEKGNGKAINSTISV